MENNRKNQYDKEVNDEILNILEKNILNKTPIDKSMVDFLIKNLNRLQADSQQRERFEKLIPQINENLSREEKYSITRGNLPIVKKENIIMKIPLFKYINKLINQLKYKNTEKSRKTKQKMLEANSQITEKKQRDLDKISPKVELEPETIVVSDIHGDMRRWNKLQEYMKSHPNNRIIIEGDAMDRGENGVNILLQIKEMCETGRVKYIPGNHDSFAYDYLRAKNTQNTDIYGQACANLNYNGGAPTIRDFEQFDKVVDNALKNGMIKKRISKAEMTKWLGNCPIQYVTQENGINYALAHALFDARLYQKDRDFNLEKAFDLKTGEYSKENSEILDRFHNCIAYREEDERTHYAPISWPKDFVVVVGHTRQNETNMKYIENNPNQPMVYIDCKKGNFQGFNLTKNKEISLEGISNYPPRKDDGR